MTTYTKANPFKFNEGGVSVTVWRDASPGSLPVHVGGQLLSEREARAVHAFINSERTPDQWTLQADGTWRKGRWTGGVDADRRAFREYVSHDDFPGTQWRDDQGNAHITRHTQSALAMLRDFLAFHAATYPTFKALDIPEVGQFIRAELRDGSVVEGEVDRVMKVRGVTAVVMGTRGYGYIFEPGPGSVSRPKDIIAWSPIDRPQPDEPTGLGAVVEVEGIMYVRRTRTTSYPWYADVRVLVDNWTGICARGPVTVKFSGVEP